MVLTCNVLPDINASDRGTWRRVRAVEFKSVFTDQPDPNDPFQFQIDEQLDDKIDTWKEPFMFLLLKEHAKYQKDGIAEPKTSQNSQNSIRTIVITSLSSSMNVLLKVVSMERVTVLPSMKCTS